MRQLRYLLIFLGLLSASCEQQLPTTPTTIQGQVVNGKNEPIVGVDIKFSGGYNYYLSPITTFEQTTKTDSQGRYKITVVVPQKTRYSSILLYSNELIVSNRSYFVQLDNGQYHEIKVRKLDFTINSKIAGLSLLTYGKQNQFNFKIVEK